MDIITTFMIPLLSSIIIGLIIHISYQRRQTKKAMRIVRRELTGLLGDVNKTDLIQSKESKYALSKRLRRIIDVYDISFPYKKVKTIKNGKEIPGEYDKELVGDE